MNDWILIIFFYAGPLAQGDSVTLATVPGFPSRSACEYVIPDIAKLTEKSMKVAKLVCVPRNRTAP